MSDFRYDRLLDVKEKLLDHKKRELDGATVALKAVFTEISHVEQEVAETYSALTVDCITGKELSLLTGYLSYLDSRKAVLHQEEKEREERIEVIRQELLNLEIERKMLEKLKSRILSTIRKTRNKKEQKLMDELALRSQ